MAPRLRHAILIAIALIVAVTCVGLGFWQLDRLHGRREINAMLAARGSEPTVPIGSLTPAALPYRYVSATGTYDPAHEVILSGRSLDGEAGNHVLTPLRLDDGSAVVVDRGWVPLDMTGLALPPDQVSVPAVSPAPTIATRIDLGRGDLPYPLLPMYVLLQAQQPPQDLPAVVAVPTLDEGPHLSYAFQWFAFATIAVVGGAVLLLRDRRGE